MKTEETICCILYTLLIVLISSTSAIISVTKYYEGMPPKIEIEEVYVSNQFSNLDDILLDFPVNRSYDIKNYNCVNYSDDLMTELAGSGYNSTSIIRCNKSMCHKWVRLHIDIEPQDGTFINYSEEYNMTIEMLALHSKGQTNSKQKAIQS